MHLQFFDDEKRGALLSTISVCAIHLLPALGFWVCVKSKGALLKLIKAIYFWDDISRADIVSPHCVFSLPELPSEAPALQRNSESGPG